MAPLPLAPLARALNPASVLGALLGAALAVLRLPLLPVGLLVGAAMCLRDLARAHAAPRGPRAAAPCRRGRLSVWLHERLGAVLLSRAPRGRDAVGAVWMDGGLLCVLVQRTTSARCPLPRHPNGHVAALKHGFRMVRTHLGVPAGFSDEELEADTLTTRMERRLVRYLGAVRRAVTRRERRQRDPDADPTREETSSTSGTGSTDSSASVSGSLSGDHQAAPVAPRPAARATRCVARGVGLFMATRGRPAIFYVYVRTIAVADLRVVVLGPGGTHGAHGCSASVHLSQPLTPSEHEQPDDTRILVVFLVSINKVEVRYTPRLAGQHRVHVSLGGSAVVGSPFHVLVAEQDTPPPAPAAEPPATAPDEQAPEAVPEAAEVSGGLRSTTSPRRVHRSPRRRRVKVVYRIVDFVKEKMLLTEDGRLERLPDAIVTHSTTPPRVYVHYHATAAGVAATPRAAPKARASKRLVTRAPAPGLRHRTRPRLPASDDSSSELGDEDSPPQQQQQPESRYLRILRTCALILKHFPKARSLHIMRTADNIVSGSSYLRRPPPLRVIHPEDDDDDDLDGLTEAADLAPSMGDTDVSADDESVTQVEALSTSGADLSRPGSSLSVEEVVVTATRTLVFGAVPEVTRLLDVVALQQHAGDAQLSDEEAAADREVADITGVTDGNVSEPPEPERTHLAWPPEGAAVSQPGDTGVKDQQHALNVPHDSVQQPVSAAPVASPEAVPEHPGKTQEPAVEGVEPAPDNLKSDAHRGSSTTLDNLATGNKHVEATIFENNDAAERRDVTSLAPSTVDLIVSESRPGDSAEVETCTTNVVDMQKVARAEAVGEAPKDRARSPLSSSGADAGAPGDAEEVDSQFKSWPSSTAFGEPEQGAVVDLEPVIAADSLDEALHQLDMSILEARNGNGQPVNGQGQAGVLCELDGLTFTLQDSGEGRGAAIWAEGAATDIEELLGLRPQAQPPDVRPPPRPPRPESPRPPLCSWMSIIKEEGEEEAPPAPPAPPREGGATPQAPSLEISSVVTSVEVGSVEVCSVEVGSVEVSSEEVGSVQVSAEEVSSVDASSVEASSVEVSSVEVSLVGVSSVEVGSVEDSSMKVSSEEVGSVDASSVEASSVDVSSVKVSPVEGTSEVSSVEVSSEEVGKVEVSSVDASLVEASSVEISSVEVSLVEVSSVGVSSVEVGSVEVSSMENSSEKVSSEVVVVVEANLTAAVDVTLEESASELPSKETTKVEITAAAQDADQKEGIEEAVHCESVITDAAEVASVDVAAVNVVPAETISEEVVLVESFARQGDAVEDVEQREEAAGTDVASAEAPGDVARQGDAVEDVEQREEAAGTEVASAEAPGDVARQGDAVEDVEQREEAAGTDVASAEAPGDVARQGDAVEDVEQREEAAGTDVASAEAPGDVARQGDAVEDVEQREEAAGTDVASAEAPGDVARQGDAVEDVEQREEPAEAPGDGAQSPVESTAGELERGETPVVADSAPAAVSESDVTAPRDHPQERTASRVETGRADAVEDTQPEERRPTEKELSPSEGAEVKVENALSKEKPAAEEKPGQGSSSKTESEDIVAPVEDTGCHHTGPEQLAVTDVPGNVEVKCAEEAESTALETQVIHAEEMKMDSKQGPCPQSEFDPFAAKAAGERGKGSEVPGTTVEESVEEEGSGDTTELREQPDHVRISPEKDRGVEVENTVTIAREETGTKEPSATEEAGELKTERSEVGQVSEEVADLRIECTQDETYLKESSTLAEKQGKSREIESPIAPGAFPLRAIVRETETGLGSERVLALKEDVAVQQCRDNAVFSASKEISLSDREARMGDTGTPGQPDIHQEDPSFINKPRRRSKVRDMVAAIEAGAAETEGAPAKQPQVADSQNHASRRITRPRHVDVEFKQNATPSTEAGGVDCKPQLEPQPAKPKEGSGDPETPPAPPGESRAETASESAAESVAESDSRSDSHAGPLIESLSRLLTEAQVEPAGEIPARPLAESLAKLLGESQSERRNEFLDEPLLAEPEVEPSSDPQDGAYASPELPHPLLRSTALVMNIEKQRAANSAAKTFGADTEPQQRGDRISLSEGKEIGSICENGSTGVDDNATVEINPEAPQAQAAALLLDSLPLLSPDSEKEIEGQFESLMSAECEPLAPVEVEFNTLVREPAPAAATTPVRPRTPPTARAYPAPKFFKYLEDSQDSTDDPDDIGLVDLHHGVAPLAREPVPPAGQHKTTAAFDHQSNTVSEEETAAAPEGHREEVAEEGDEGGAKEGADVTANAENTVAEYGAVGALQARLGEGVSEDTVGHLADIAEALENTIDGIEVGEVSQGRAKERERRKEEESLLELCDSLLLITGQDQRVRAGPGPGPSESLYAAVPTIEPDDDILIVTQTGSDTTIRMIATPPLSPRPAPAPSTTPAPAPRPDPPDHTYRPPVPPKPPARSPRRKQTLTSTSMAGPAPSPTLAPGLDIPEASPAPGLDTTAASPSPAPSPSTTPQSDSVAACSPEPVSPTTRVDADRKHPLYRSLEDVSDTKQLSLSAPPPEAEADLGDLDSLISEAGFPLSMRVTHRKLFWDKQVQRNAEGEQASALARPQRAVQRTVQLGGKAVTRVTSDTGGAGVAAAAPRAEAERPTPPTPPPKPTPRRDRARAARAAAAAPATASPEHDQAASRLQVLRKARTRTGTLEAEVEALPAAGIVKSGRRFFESTAQQQRAEARTPCGATEILDPVTRIRREIEALERRTQQVQQVRQQQQQDAPCSSSGGGPKKRAPPPPPPAATSSTACSCSPVPGPADPVSTAAPTIKTTSRGKRSWGSKFKTCFT
ncbi:Myosin-1 [Frankliniella fusca]|uniref:Myosin-1 n=1 Tax=Frankliniella fusca TaxID=407009 RepID=A0AAE1GR41_9NEOP|nr:Myosin-1 [Frankliniella fusca]